MAAKQSQAAQAKQSQALNFVVFVTRCFSVGAGKFIRVLLPLAAMVLRCNNAASNAREGRLEVEIAEHDDDKGDTKAASKVREIQKSMQSEVRTLQGRVQILEKRLDAHRVRQIEKADLVGDEVVGDEGKLEVEIAEHNDDISICEGDGNAAASQAPLGQAGPRSAKPAKPGEGAKADPARPSRAQRRPSRQPVDFCVRSSRWRDAKGRFCREPSPAAPHVNS
jgi:hypothetical protein